MAKSDLHSGIGHGDGPSRKVSAALGAGPHSALPSPQRAANSAAIALFDLDGTITRRDTYLAYLLGFLVRHPVTWPRAAPLPIAVLCYLAGWHGNTWLKTTFLHPLFRALPPSRLEAWTNSFLDGLPCAGVRPGALEGIERHRATGHRLLVPITASLDFYAAPLGGRMGFDAVLCTRAAYDAGDRVTGALDGDNCYGLVKLRRVQHYLAAEAAGLPVICYSDHHTDLPLLRFATKAVKVNPSRRLKGIATLSGITVENWN